MSMAKRLLPLLLLLLLLFVPPRPAVASNKCPDYGRSAELSDYLLEGRIKAWPLPSIFILEVDRYYKGSGPRILITQPTGLLTIDRWAKYLRGNPFIADGTRIFGFQRGWGIKWGTPYCDLWNVTAAEPSLASALVQYGEGTPPVDGIALHSHAVFTAPLFLVMVSAAIVWWWRRRRRRR